MTSYFSGFVYFVGAHPQYAVTVVFMLALSEAIPVIGTVVPGFTLSPAGASAEQLTLLIIAGLIVVSAVCWFLPRASVEIARARANRLRPTCFSNPPELQ
jgi:hypothetical protein